MSRGKLLGLVLFLILPLSACGLGGVKAQESAAIKVVNKYHKSVEPAYCSQCHIRQGEQYQLKTVDPVKACQSCHLPSGHDHPFSMVSPGAAFELPLYSQKIACLTCHDPHNQAGYPALLRKEITQLCPSCHQQK